MTTQDVFISYAHLDNEALFEDQEGWISIFHRALQKRLGQLLGRSAVVWWDQKRLSGNCYFDDTIAAAVDVASVMVSVVTPRYLKSDYCRKEVEHFAKRPGGLRVGDRSRLFTCVKTPIPREALFSQMEGKLGYEFFRAEEEEGRFREYDIHDPELKPRFMAVLEDLAQDVSRLVARLEQGARSEPPAARPSGINLKPREPNPLPTQQVLLATSSGDVKPVREGLLRELSARGYEIQPAEPWREDAAGFEQGLAQAASGVCLSVHILGGSYGTIPEDAAASYPVLQFERMKQLAFARSADAPCARIVWIPRDVKPGSEKQSQFLTAVRSDATLGVFDELLEGTEEELKERVMSKLQTLAAIEQARLEQQHAARQDAARATQPPAAESNPSGRPTLGAVKKVYVISADSDEGDHVMEIEKTLDAQGLDVISSSELQEEETEPAREALHQRWLEECDGCLIYHGNSKVSWVRAQVDEVRKALGHRVAGPMLGHAVYVAPPLEALKRRYQVHFPKLEGVGEPLLDLLPFVQQVIADEPVLDTAALPQVAGLC